MSRRNFPSFIEAFLDYSNNVGAPHKFLLWSAISGIAAALERKTWLSFNGLQVIYPNMYIMLVADSGIARKSTATRALMEIVYEVDNIKHMSTQLSAASLVEQLVEAGNEKTFEILGIKYKNSSLYAYASEAKVTIGDQKGLSGIQELLTDFYDCGTPNIWSVSKGWSKKTLSGGHHTVFNPCLNMLACSTPLWLNEAIGKSGIEGGFASRVIFVNQKERENASPGWLDDSDERSTKSAKTKKLLIEDLTKISQLQGKFRTESGWKETYNEIQAEINKKIDLGGDMKSYYSRKMWHMLKLSQILAADQNDDLIVGPEHLMAAKEVLETIEPEMYSPFFARGENKNLGSLLSTWEVIRKRKVWRKQTIYNSTFRHATSPQLDDHLKTLVGMGKIKFSPEAGEIVYRVVDPTPLGESNVIVEVDGLASN